jgi:hypothetical protein
VTASRVFGKRNCPKDKIYGLEKNNRNKNIIDMLYMSEVDIHISLPLVVWPSVVSSSDDPAGARCMHSKAWISLANIVITCEF